MCGLNIEGVSQKDLDMALQKIVELQEWAKNEKLDGWAFRAALLKALYDNADEYFAQSKMTYREIAAFDNGVAHALEASKNNQKS